MTYIPNDLYEIRIYNHSGVLVTILSNVTHIEYSQRKNQAWNHQITIETSYMNPVVNTVRSFLDDYFVLIYRYDGVTGDKDLVYEGLNYTVVDQMSREGTIIFNLYGAGYTDLLNRRVVLPTAGLEHNTKTGQAEGVLKAYVNDCMVMPEDITRIMSGFVIEPSADTGGYVEQNIRYILLSTVVKNIADDGKIDFGVVGSDPPGQFMLRARPIWGLDKRVGNADGNVPVLFDVFNGNMDIPILSTNASEEKNYIYVGGEGTGTERIIGSVPDPVAISRSPWCRKEAFVDARREDGLDGVQSSGSAYLEENKCKQSLSFNIAQNKGTRWLRDWGLGDITSSRYFTYLFDKQITEVRVQVDAGEEGAVETISAEMLDVR